ncbi:ATP-dependent RNA helicase DeaD [Maridesulfovibrio ferrireducens]|uniref:RNA helicase n=1 Tax=Maridesulfovibrio ferrireducens TaxID=246191 RepID=A0A1G9G1E3_9BACT|nr:DEAD/DEAH box helicase [Maridesulfovibrio ferrireducens]SDK94492.1 ATP-dependent RNA helicase DeaD [Maridesulfovibrio ferrireducens]
MEKFRNLGLSDAIIDALSKKGFTEPTPIQAQTIPMLLSGEKDIVGQAQTGTGKTAAFGLPILENVREGAGHVQAIVLTPTRELAMQVADEISSFRGNRRVRIATVYGGQAMLPQLRALKSGADIVVGTPGRVLDHIKRKTLKLADISFFVLDEADEMCNMGFLEDVSEIMENASGKHRTLLFSATMPQAVMRIARKFMGDYDVVSVKPEKNEIPLTEQVYHEMPERDRLEALCRVIDSQNDFYGLVFCRTRADADRVAAALNERKYPAEPIHGDLSQSRREEILRKFRNRKCKILVATDVAARGIDVPDLTHVVNFALPQDPQSYVHRIGRTGRAGKSGIAVTLINPHEFGKLRYISKVTGAKIEKKALPTIDQVIEAKKAHMGAELTDIVTNGKHLSYLPLASELLESSEAVEIIAALLKHSQGNVLDKKTYRRIDEGGRNGASGSARGRVRFTACVGRAHGMTPRKLVDMICLRSKINPVRIQHVKINGQQSTFSVPGDDSDRVMSSVNKSSNNGKPLLRRA